MPPTSLEPVETEPRSRMVRLASVILVAVLLGVGGWLYFSGKSAQKTHADFYNSLVAENKSFAEAEQLARENRYAEALLIYQNALQQSKDEEERLQIQLLTARTMVQVETYAEAVPLLKEIVASGENPRTARTRALAVMEIANIYLRGSFEANGEIFKDEPFKSLWVKNDAGLTLRHVYEYSVSIFPTALAQLYIAQSYALQLPDVGKESQTLTDEEVQSYLLLTHNFINAANQDIEYLRTQDAMARDYHMALLARAVVVGHLNRHGDTSQGGADEPFMEAIDAFVTEGPGEDGVARYFYATFLAQTYGDSRKKDIQTILAPLYGVEYERAGVVDMLKNARFSSYYRQFPILLARIDPNFKAFLMKLGWTKSDFSS